MSETAMDSRPDVDIRLRAIPAGDPRQPASVVGEAECRFCPESMSSADPRTLVKWADAHEASFGHIDTKREMQEGVPVAPPVAPPEESHQTVSQGPPGDIFGTPPERPPMRDVPWGLDAHAVDQVLGSDRPL